MNAAYASAHRRAVAAPSACSATGGRTCPPHRSASIDASWITASARARERRKTNRHVQPVVARAVPDPLLLPIARRLLGRQRLVRRERRRERVARARRVRFSPYPEPTLGGGAKRGERLAQFAIRSLGAPGDGPRRARAASQSERARAREAVDISSAALHSDEGPMSAASCSCRLAAACAVIASNNARSVAVAE